MILTNLTTLISINTVVMTVIGLDLDSSQVFILGSHQRFIGNMEELHQVVQDEITKLGDRSWGGKGDGMNCNNHSESKT